MAACEECWANAFLRSQLSGGSQVDHYRDLLQEFEALHAERADPEGPALSGSHHSGANSRPDASPIGPDRAE